MGPKDRKPFADPFGKLKGFRASGPPETKAPAPPTPPAEEAEDEGAFAREMARLGISAQAEPPGKAAAEAPAGAEPPGKPPADDRELFLAAVGRMEATFHDEFPQAEKPAAPRRMKLVKQGKLLPEVTLDLHGLDRLQARERVRHFLEDAAWQGRRTVLVITGRGTGSGGEPVLRQVVEEYLAREAGALVGEWGRAPARHGGDGAIIVFLRGRKKESPSGG